METLSISQKCSAGLALLNALSEPALASLCKFFLQSVVAGNSAVVVEDHEALCAVSTLLLEGARANSPAAQIRAVLTECGVNASASAVLSELYSTHLETLQQHMRRTGIALPEIVDIDWRLDYVVSAKNPSPAAAHAPLFFLSLRVKDRGLYRDVDMVASQEELQDLLARVRDAVKQVDRVVAEADA